jgi:2-oxoglutarate ferredoxin oxidoreductase subunit alpha
MNIYDLCTSKNKYEPIYIIMAELEVKELEQVVVRFSGDSGDGMQLAGNIFSTVSATVGNGISTFPDYPADIRAPQGSLTGVSGFQVHIGAGKVYTPGDLCDVLVAMNAAALKTQLKYSKPQATIIIDTDSFGPKDLEKAQFKTEDYLGELGIDPDRVIQCPLTTMVKDCLADTGMDNKAILKCRNMFALGLVCWLFDRDLSLVANFLREKFAKKPAIAENNIKVVQAGTTMVIIPTLQLSTSIALSPSTRNQDVTWTSQVTKLPRMVSLLLPKRLD